MADRIPLLLDTDIGSDVDDAIALAYLLAHQRCDLLGITTVSGDVARRAACAEILCRAAGRTDIPIHTGSSDVLLVGPGQPGVPNYDVISHHPHRLDRPAATAVEFMRQTIRSRPGEITLLGTGPMTNIALLFAIDPEIPQMLRALVTMNGVFFEGQAKHELNALVDPFATAMTYNANTRHHVCVGLDVTHPCHLTVAQVRQNFLSPVLKLVCEMADNWLERPSDFYLNDTVAAALTMSPQLGAYTVGRVTVPLDIEPESAGRTLFTPSAKGPHTVAHSIDVAAFQQELLGTLNSPPTRVAV